jgi:hypothetical protein
MEIREKFSGILVFEDGPDIYARNEDGRILFRYNKIDKSVAFFRSHRMTDEEKEFCSIMFDKYNVDISILKEDMVKALSYQINRDLYCT